LIVVLEGIGGGGKEAKVASNRILAASELSLCGLISALYAQTGVLELEKEQTSPTIKS